MTTRTILETSVFIDTNAPSNTPEVFQKARQKDLSILKNSRLYTTQDSNGNTPLHYLAEQGVSEILEIPESETLKNKNGETPLELYSRLYQSMMEEMDLN